MRCYAAAFVWVPIISGVLLGNVSIPLAFALAVVWRYRETRAASGGRAGSRRVGKASPLADVRVGVATRRSCGRPGARDRGRRHGRGVGRHRVRRASRVPGSPRAALGDPVGAELLARRDGLDARLSEGVGQVVTLVVGVALLVGCVVFARRGDEERSFTCAVAATLALSPIVWLHYLVLLLVPLAILRPASRSSGCYLPPVGEPAAGLRRGVRDLHAGARRRPSSSPCCSSGLARARAGSGRAGVSDRQTGASTPSRRRRSPPTSCYGRSWWAVRSSWPLFAASPGRTDRLRPPRGLPAGRGGGRDGDSPYADLDDPAWTSAGIRLPAAACVRSRAAYVASAGSRGFPRLPRRPRRATRRRRSRRGAGLRCYAAVLLWAPTWNSLDRLNVSALLSLGVALVWRFRSTLWPLAATLGAMVSVKLFLWPLLVWVALDAAPRAAASPRRSGQSCRRSARGRRSGSPVCEYPELLSKVGTRRTTRSSPSRRIRARPCRAVLALLVGGALLVAAVWSWRKGEEIGSFTLAVAACLALSPVVWLHYLVADRAARTRPPALLCALAAADSAVGEPA